MLSHPRPCGGIQKKLTLPETAHTLKFPGQETAGGMVSERHVLDSWKEISAYLNRSGRTCRTWEIEFGLPIHRLEGSPKARVFAYPEELDRWLQQRVSSPPSNTPSPSSPCGTSRPEQAKTIWPTP